MIISLLAGPIRHAKPEAQSSQRPFRPIGDGSSDSSNVQTTICAKALFRYAASALGIPLTADTRAGRTERRLPAIKRDAYHSPTETQSWRENLTNIGVQAEAPSDEVCVRVFSSGCAGAHTDADQIYRLSSGAVL